MPACYRLAVVEDNAPQRMILTRLLETEHTVQGFDSGEAFLACETAFDAILLDIEMPGLNGYDTCRRLRQRTTANDLPVIFVSAHDTAPERVAAYEAGGDDFVTKPITAHELRHKVNTIVERQVRLRELSSQSTLAQQVAFTAMSSMGDLGVIINFMRASATVSKHDQLAGHLLDAMRSWGLQGAVQIRGKTGDAAYSTEGDLSPLQGSVLESLKGMGRLFEMGSRAIINYPQVSLLVQNLPVDDLDKVGRLRDHLAVLAESADVRISGLDAISERDLQKVGVEGALAELRAAVQRFALHSQSNRTRGQQHVLEMLEQLGRTLITLGLSESQEAYVDDLLKDTTDEALRYFDEASHLEDEFSDVVRRLERLAAGDYRF